MAEKNYDDFITKHTLDCDFSRRGGTLKIDVSELFPNVEDAVMGAYQNYLGGGMLGAVVGAAQFDPNELSKKDQKVFIELKEAIKQYFFHVTNEEATEYDEWIGQSYEQNKNMPASAY